MMTAQKNSWEWVTQLQNQNTFLTHYGYYIYKEGHGWLYVEYGTLRI